jgi:hypothetical protein
MKKYIGVKVVQAEPKAEDGVEGYKIIYSEPDKPDYVSWCPKDEFERQNWIMDAMPFSMALEALKQGEKVAAARWNGKYVLSCVEGGRSYKTIIKTSTARQTTVTWVPNQTEIMSDKWLIVD